MYVIFVDVLISPIDIFSMIGMILVQSFSLIPLLFIFFVAALRGFNNVLEEAAQTSGANSYISLRFITLPLLRPHLLAGMLLALIFSIEAFPDASKPTIS